MYWILATLGLMPALNSTMETDCADSPLPAFELEYLVTHDGKRAGVTTAQLRRHGQDWEYVVHSRARGGPGGMISVEQSDRTVFRWDGARPRPVRHEGEQSVSFVRRDTQTRFDWSGARARGQYRGDAFELPLRGDELDRNLIQLALAIDAQKGQRQFGYASVDRGRLRKFSYRADAVESIQVPAGTFSTIPVARVAEDEDKDTRVWLAEDLFGLPVRISRSKDDAPLVMELSQVRWLDCAG